MISLMLINSQKGSLNFLVLFLILVLIGAGVSANIPVKRNYSDGKGSVQGVMADNKGSKPDPDGPKIATDGGQTAVVKGTAGALSNFPLSLNGNTLVVTTPAGQKSVTVLPDQAIKNMLASRIMTDVTSVDVKNSLASINELVTLEERNGVLVYKIDGVKKHMILGFIPFKTQVKAFVSAESGEVVDTEQSLLGKILNKISS